LAIRHRPARPRRPQRYSPLAKGRTSTSLHIKLAPGTHQKQNQRPGQRLNTSGDPHRPWQRKRISSSSWRRPAWGSPWRGSHVGLFAAPARDDGARQDHCAQQLGDHTSITRTGLSHRQPEGLTGRNGILGRGNSNFAGARLPPRTHRPPRRNGVPVVTKPRGGRWSLPPAAGQGQGQTRKTPRPPDYFTSLIPFRSEGQQAGVAGGFESGASPPRPGRIGACRPWPNEQGQGRLVEAGLPGRL